MESVDLSEELMQAMLELYEQFILEDNYRIEFLSSDNSFNSKSYKPNETQQISLNFRCPDCKTVIVEQNGPPEISFKCNKA